jgi:hypothetical protein
MDDYYEIDFLPVHTSKSGDAIAIRYQLNGAWWVHVVDGGYTSTAPDLAGHIIPTARICDSLGIPKSVKL